MADIAQPTTSLGVVHRRMEGRSQGKGGEPPPDAPPKKVAETYQEADKARPLDDRVTILGIPMEQITPSMQAALAGLVTEINYLRTLVKRQQRAESSDGASPAILPQHEFMRALDVTLSQSPGDNSVWVVVLVHVVTYEDIRRSSGVLPANSALADVAQRLSEIRFGGIAEDSNRPSIAFAVAGHCGGSTLCAVAALPEQYVDATAVAQAVRDRLVADGYRVAGIDMALAISVAAAPVGTGESSLLAIGRVDHLIRGGR